MSLELSIIIPAYNEEAIIVETLEKVEQYVRLSGRPTEVIVVDDGSKDSTASLVADFINKHPGFRLVKNTTNQGKGFTIKRGVSECRGKFVLFSDADLSTPINEADKLLKWLREGFDVAIGIRGGKSQTNYIAQPALRRWSGKAFSYLVSLATGLPPGDTQCGFKAYTREAAGSIFPRQRVKGFAFDVENLFLAHKLRLRVKHVPVDWINNPDSRVHLLKDSTRMFVDLAIIKFNSLRGKYDIGSRF